MLATIITSWSIFLHVRMGLLKWHQMHVHLLLKYDIAGLQTVQALSGVYDTVLKDLFKYVKCDSNRVQQMQSKHIGGNT